MINSLSLSTSAFSFDNRFQSVVLPINVAKRAYDSLIHSEIEANTLNNNYAYPLLNLSVA